MSQEENKQSDQLRDANHFIAIGAGVGAVGLALETAVEGFMCPMCLFIAPSLVGVGILKRIRTKIKNRRLTKSSYIKIRQKSYKPKADRVN